MQNVLIKWSLWATFFGSFYLYSQSPQINPWSPFLENTIQEQNNVGTPAFDLKETDLLVFPGINSEFEKKDSFQELEKIAAESQGKIELNVYWPNSLASAEENALSIVDLLEEKIAAWKPTDPKLLLLGHSKGGLELFLACLSRPDLCNSEAVSLVSILQAPVMGTSTADELFDESGQPLKFFSILFFFMPSVNSKVVLGEGMKSVRTQAVLDIYSEIDLEALSKKLRKIIFIAGDEDIKDWSKELKVPGRNFTGDGVIPLSQARHEAFTEAPSYKLNCDHLDLVIKKPRSNKVDTYKVSFWKSLLGLRELLLQATP